MAFIFFFFLAYQFILKALLIWDIFENHGLVPKRTTLSYSLTALP